MDGSASLPFPLSPQRTALKRQMSDEDSMLGASSPKKAHYEEKISDDFDGIRIYEDSSASSSPQTPIIVEEDFDRFEELLDFASTSYQDDTYEQPVVEEPAEDETLVLTDELKDYIQRMKSQPFILRQPRTGKELILYNQNDMNSRIQEVEDKEDDEFEEAEPPNDLTQQFEAAGDEEDAMEID
ncbi:unnamed protein product [Bursaphelenchus xylophilus]|uniref:(pine wood nematode) hypothetical protein n=1 Tax=Bursaphelenchus xylophilus TaxID=6326 RepID=A0A1I7RQW5_BURXY|nr:unnamed protein product [Bursaphelenchus xylophilus]CAG9130713.1 unnamed protein product [Bursaphelenchus xylophilus]